MTYFPTDELTLILLESACTMNDETGQTHLMDFLSMGEKVLSEKHIGDADGIPIYDVELEPGTEPFSPQHVIVSLIAEIRRLRAQGEDEG